MKIPKKIVDSIEAKTIEIHAKVCDAGTYTLVGPSGNVIATREDYVPGFFPEEHYGDYLILNVDLETGQILNWKKPAPEAIARAFALLEEET